MTYSELALASDAVAEGLHDLTVESVLTDVEVFKFLEVLQVLEEHTDALLVLNSVVFEGKGGQIAE